MKKIRQIVGAAVSAVIAASVVAACSSAPSSTGAAAQQTSGPVTLQLFGEELPASMAPIIKGFEAKYPGITVKYSSAPFSQYANVLQQRLGAKDSTIDVYEVDQPRLASLAARGYLVPINQDNAQAKAALLPEQYQVSLYDNELYALPLWTSDQFLFYNADLLKKAGVTAPGISAANRWTWEQTVQAAKSVQRLGVPYGLLFEQQDSYYQLEPLMVSAGGGTGITGADGLTADVTNPDWVKAMTWYGGLFADKVSPRGVNPQTYGNLFASGKAAFFVGGPWDINIFAHDKGLNWGMAPQPYFAGGKQVTPTDSQSLGLNPAGGHQAAALKFIEYASLTKAGALTTIASPNTFLPPSNQSAFSTYLAKVGSVHPPATTGAAALIKYDAANTAVSRPRSVGYLEFESVMDQAFADIANGANPQSRLAQAQQDVTSQWGQLK
jgi:multiple sugar transport system substrate-binding protein